MTHKDADASKKRIAIPNEFGLCVAHYVSKFGAPPKKLALPFPGMEKRVKEEEKIMTIEEELTHPLRPSGAPEMEDPPAVYIEPIPPKSFRGKLAKMLITRRQNLKIETSGNQAATRIQKNYRMYACKCLANVLRRQKLALRRYYAAVRVQSVARRYIQKEEVEEIKKNTVAAVNLVIRLCRGMLARKAVKRKKAAKVLQRGGLRGEDLKFANGRALRISPRLKRYQCNFPCNSLRSYVACSLQLWQMPLCTPSRVPLRSGTSMSTKNGDTSRFSDTPKAS